MAYIFAGIATYHQWCNCNLKIPRISCINVTAEVATFLFPLYLFTTFAEPKENAYWSPLIVCQNRKRLSRNNNPKAGLSYSRGGREKGLLEQRKTGKVSMFAAVFRLLRLFFWPIVTTSSWVERLVARAKRAKKQTSRTSLSLFLPFGTTHNQSSPTADFLSVQKIWNAALVQQVLQKCEITWKSVLVSGLRKFPDVGKKYSDFNWNCYK